MKRSWKVDNDKPVGWTYVWKGDVEKLPAPWIKIETADYFPKHTTLQEGYHGIKKLDKLEWLEQYEQRRRDTR